MELAPFYVGQKVVVIKDHSQGVIKKGEIYIVINIYKNCCEWVVEIGIKPNNKLDMCSLCKNVYDAGKYYRFGYSLFAPINEAHNFQAISYSKVMEKESKLICVN